MIATASYAHPRTGQSATVTVYHVPPMREVVASATLDGTAKPLWTERLVIEHGEVAVAETNARLWGNLYARRLKREYHMRRVA